MASVFTAYGTIKPYRAAEKSFQDNAQNVANTVAIAAEFAVFYHSKEPLQQLSKSALRNKHIEGITFSDTTGKIIYQEGYINNNITLNLDLLTTNQAIEKQQHWYFSAPIIITGISVSDYELDATSSIEQTAGYVLVAASDADTLLAQQQLIRNNLLVSAICLLAAIMLAVRLSTAIIRPVDTLTQLAGDMAAGKLNKPAGQFSLRELQILGNSFNHLASRVKQSNAQLNQRINAATQKLQESTQHLRDQNHDLIDTRQKLLQANRAKDQFLAHMSHELRTPLTTVIGFSKLLKKTDMTGHQKEHIRAIEQASSMLLAIIDDILDVSKIQSNAIELESKPFDFIFCIEDVISMHTHAAFSKQLELVLLVDPDVPNLLIGDSVRIRQVFNNLLGNAIKFTEHGEVIVTLSVDSIDNNTLQLHASIRDNGIGISAEQQAMLFQPFIQADSSISRRFGGTGLGLMISRQLIELMSGSIELHSEENKGTEICFNLCLEIQSPQDQSAKLLPSRIDTLLIYDPHALSRRSIRNLALDWTTHVFSCGSQSRLFELLLDQQTPEQHKNYHCVIIGLAAGEVNDSYLEALLSTVRCHHQGPVLLLACMDDIESILSQHVFERYQPIACLSKPLRQETLFSHLNELGGKRSLQPLQPPQNALPLQGHAILIAEDNQLNRKLISELLTTAGAKCSSVSNGQEAIDAAKNHDYAAILMDMHMPDTDGLEATAVIRNHPGANTNTPIIGLTASVLSRDEEAFKVCGANRVLQKPIDEDHLIASLLELLGEKIPNHSFKGFLASHINEQQFQQEIRRHFAKTKESWQQQSMQRMYFYCHQLLGLAEAFGDESLAKPLRRLHDALQLQQYAQVEEYFLDTERAFKSLTANTTSES